MLASILYLDASCHNNGEKFNLHNFEKIFLGKEFTSFKNIHS